MLYKRVNKEIELLKEKYNILNYSENYNEIIIHIDYDNIKIILNDHYPFKPPKMYINDIDYIQYLVNLQNTKADKLKELDEICLCCKTILCHNNWKPAFKITQIIDEYDRFNLI